MLMVESIVQHISGQIVVDDCLVAQDTFGVIWCRETWFSTSFKKFLQQVSQEFGMSICSTFNMLQPVKAFSVWR